MDGKQNQVRKIPLDELVGEIIIDVAHSKLVNVSN